MSNWKPTRLTNLRLRGSPGQTQDFFKIEDSNKVELFAIDVTGNVRSSGVVGVTRKVVKVALTAANLIAMYTTPVQLVAAPGAGFALVAQEVLLEMIASATAFTGGGIVVAQYDSTAHGAGVAVHAGSIPAAVINAGAGTTLTGLWAASGSNGLTAPANKGIFISNQTAVFATGTGTAIAYVTYELLTL